MRRLFPLIGLPLVFLLSMVGAVDAQQRGGGGSGGGGMDTSASNATLPTSRNNLGAGVGDGVNIVTDYGADPTGAVNADTTG